MLRELSSLIAGLREWRNSVATSDEKEGDVEIVAAWLEVESAMPPTNACARVNHSHFLCLSESFWHTPKPSRSASDAQSDTGLF